QKLGWLGWVYTNSTKRVAQVQQFGTIQMECLHRCAAYRSASNNDHEVLTPRKVTCPMLAAWIKEWYDTPHLWVASMSFGIFMTVTCWTRPGQFGQGIAPTAHTRQNMFTDKRRTSMTGRMLTIFTTSLSTISHLLPHNTWDSFTCHPHHT